MEWGGIASFLEGRFKIQKDLDWREHWALFNTMFFSGEKMIDSALRQEKPDGQVYGLAE